jgi:hypothetical protein
MGKTIPRGFPFVKDSLTLEETADFLSWYNFLGIPDKRNLGKVLRASYDEIRFHRPFLYFVMNAIGGTARAESNHEDIDLLMFTNVGLIGWNRLRYLDLGLRRGLEDSFDYAWDMSPDDAYFKVDRPERLVLKLTPLRGRGKEIHLTLQPEISSEKEWDEYDQEPRVVIYRSGDVTGCLLQEKSERGGRLRGLGVSLVAD